VEGAVTFARDEINELPASLRFFAGGDRSVRGYAYQSLGPRDSAGNVVGGKNLIVGSLEFERAVGTDIGIAVFYDAGNAFNSINDITLFQGAGIGVRYYTRVGAVRLDLARQIGVDKPHFRLHFALGYEL
jgi:translocation and assembly module TamA